MSELSVSLVEKEENLKMGDKLSQDVDEQHSARALSNKPHRTKLADGELPPKKRKTRRGKSKRRLSFMKNSRKSNKLVKPEAPHNSNQFLLEDHGLIEDLDRNLKRIDKISPTTHHTRDSSFSIDSDVEFYSSPDDEEQFLIKDFDDQYESVQAERLQTMSKAELIEEYLVIENKLELLSKRLQKTDDESEDSRPDLKQEIEKLTSENERLRRENDMLRSKMNLSDSEDSETDSSDSCGNSSSSSTSCSSRSRSPLSNNIDYSETNGHRSSVEAV